MGAATGLTAVVSREPDGVHDDHVVVHQGLGGGVEVAVQAAIRLRAAVVTDADHARCVTRQPGHLGPAAPRPPCRGAARSHFHLAPRLCPGGTVRGQARVPGWSGLRAGAPCSVHLWQVWALLVAGARRKGASLTPPPDFLTRQCVLGWSLGRPHAHPQQGGPGWVGQRMSPGPDGVAVQEST